MASLPSTTSTPSTTSAHVNAPTLLTIAAELRLNIYDNFTAILNTSETNLIETTSSDLPIPQLLQVNHSLRAEGFPAYVSTLKLRRDEQRKEMRALLANQPEDLGTLTLDEVDEEADLQVESIVVHELLKAAEEAVATGMMGGGWTKVKRKSGKSGRRRR